MAGDSEPQRKPPLSCTSCRARKLKCDKQDPCHHCARSGSECVFPSRKRIQRPRKTKNTELLQRLSRLESIVGRVGLANLEAVEARLESSDTPAAEPQFHPVIGADPTPHGEHDPAPCGLESARPSQDNTTSRYMSGEFWSSLCDEVGGLRQALEQTTDSEDEDDDGDGTTPESIGNGSGSIGIPIAPWTLLSDSQTGSVQASAIEHPSPGHIRYLASVYFRNVDMHLKILHRPTMLKALHDLADHPETASTIKPEKTSLLFAMYYAAVTSLTAAECTSILGRPRADLARLFEAGIKQALMRADYLNNTSLETVQALTLYTCCLRSHNGSRAAWVLLGLPIRLAQALDLHRDGDGTRSRYSPFEAEQRRRLWWQLIVLDIRAAEDRGTSTIIARGSYDTRLPYNLDDAEFGPDSVAPLRDRTGPSDITFGLFTAQSSCMFLWSSQSTPQQRADERETLRRALHLESQFVQGADPAHIASYLASVTVRLIILRMWLTVRYPLHPRGAHPSAAAVALEAAVARRCGAILPPGGDDDTSMPDNASTPGGFVSASSPSTAADRPAPTATITRQSTLRTAISIMELSCFLETGPHADRTRWWCETYVQWHALAVALAELCTQTQGDVVERAWRVIELVFPRWGERIADTKRGNLWRPIRKLYKKAKAVREEVMREEAMREEALGDVVEGGWGASWQQQQPQPQAQLGQGRSAPQPQPNGPQSQVDHMLIDPALTASSNPKIGGIRPRLITDMILSESSAHTLTREPPALPTLPYTTTAAAPTGADVMNKDQNSRYSSSSSSSPPSLFRTSTTTGTTAVDTMTSTGTPLPFDLHAIIRDSGQSLAQAFLAWPDVSFDMPTVRSFAGDYFNNNSSSSSSSHPAPPSQGGPVSTRTAGAIVVGEGFVPADPALLETDMMGWSTWDEFVLDTYADSTPNSGSGRSEGT